MIQNSKQLHYRRGYLVSPFSLRYIMITQKELNKLLHPPTYDLYILQGLNIKSLEELVGDVAKKAWNKMGVNERKFGTLKTEFKLFNEQYVIRYRRCYITKSISKHIDGTFDFDFDKKGEDFLGECAEVGAKPQNHKHLKEVLYRKIVKYLQTGQKFLNTTSNT